MYSLDFRRRVLLIRAKEKLSLAATSKRFHIAVNTLFLWTKRLEPKLKRHKPSTKVDMEALKEDVARHADAFIHERARRLSVSRGAIEGGLKGLRVTYKKSLAHPKASAEARGIFQRTLENLRQERRPIVFIDESGFAHDMPRTHGYAPKGQRCLGTHDWGAKGRTNVIGALLRGTLLTLALFQTTIDTRIFTAWVMRDLLPKLPRKSVVVMDNASFHKGEAMKKALQEAGHTLLYLPPYSPDLNPIEHKWAQAKKIRRKTQASLTDLFNNKKL